MDLNSRIDARLVTNVYRSTYDKRKIESLYRAMPEAGATKKEFSIVNSISLSLHKV